MSKDVKKYIKYNIKIKKWKKVRIRFNKVQINFKKESTKKFTLYKISRLFYEIKNILAL